MTWEEIFTSSNPAGGRMINVISGAAGSDASPYTANNPSGGRAINVNLIGGGTVGTGFLQITGGVLDTTLRNVTDNSATPVVSPLQLSTTQVGITGPVQTGTGSLYNPLRIGYSNSTISVTNLDLFSVGATANSGSRYSTILRLGGGSDTAEHYIYGGEGSSTGLIFDRGNTKIAIIGGIFESRGAVNYYRSVNSAVSAFTDLQFDVRNTYYQFNAGTGMGLGITSGVAARLHVRGDGTNPILRTEDNSGNAVGVIAYNTRLDIYGRNFSSNEYLVNIYNGLSWGATSGTVGFLNFSNTSFSAGAGSANFRPLNIAYTINNSGAQTGTATGIFLDATETALNGMAHNLMDLQVGGVSQFRVGRTGGAVANSFTGTTYFSLLSEQRLVLGTAPNRTILISTGDSILTLLNGAENNFNRVNLGGTTNAFPAIKRNSAAIDFRLADDSGFCDINAKAIVCTSTGLNNGSRNITYDDSYSGLEYQGFGGHTFKVFNGSTYVEVMRVTGNSATPSLVIGASSGSASAILQADSTTQGFLPPRGTNTEMLAIPSPATGLVFYDTTNNKLNCYDGTTWQPCW
jgi:hypothetical protein